MSNIDLKALDQNEINNLLSKLTDWEYDSSKKLIKKTFKFKGYYKTIAFVNFIAWHAQRLCHHPDLFISFGKCHVELTTHDVDGLSIKDFELANLLDTYHF